VSLVDDGSSLAMAGAYTRAGALAASACENCPVTPCCWTPLPCAACTPIAAVEAITTALIAGFDPAADLPRQVVPVRSGQLLLMPSEGARFGAHVGIKVAPWRRTIPLADCLACRPGTCCSTPSP
jgi:hypothetical protein